MDNLEEIKKFSTAIFEKVDKEQLEYIDAIVSYCEELDIEIDLITELISPALKEKLEEEALSLRLIKSSTNRFTF